MEDKNQEALRNYQLKINSVYRARGAYLLETDQGPKLFKSFHGSENRVLFEHAVKDHLRQNGYPNVDCFMSTVNGTVLSEDSAGNKYTIRDWYGGEECNLRDIYQMEEAIRQLAQLHLTLQHVSLTEEQVEHNQMVNLHELFDKRNRELKRVRSYIRDKKQRNEFETIYVSYYDIFYQAGQKAVKLLSEMDYDTLVKEAISNREVCHGSYNHHNVFVTELGIFSRRNRCYEEKEVLEAASLHRPEYDVAIMNFDKAYVGLQVYDLYQFMRKAMEKNEWDLLYGSRILEAYNQVKPLKKEELNLLYILLLYPEKFWKITNYYFNGKKSWVSDRNIQKLINVGEQNSKKEIFLEKLQDIL